jgi:CHAD domain-containing protein
MHPDIASGTFASNVVTRLLERLAYRVNAAVHRHDEDSIHELRVATRRFTQSLAIFKDLYHAKDLKKIRRRLKDLMDLSSAVRDCDVAGALIAKSELPGATALQKPLAARRKEAVRMLLPTLRAWAARRTTSKWRGALTPNGASATPLAELVSDRAPHVAKKFFREADDASSASDLHRARIHAKKLRYSLELLRPAYDARFDNAIEQIRAVQSLLGKAHDGHAVRVLVTELGGDDELESWLKKRERKNTREFKAAWKASSPILREAMRELKHPDRKPVRRAASSAPARQKTA